MSTRIKDLTNDTTPAGADAVPIDHATDGVRKTLLSSIASLFASLMNGTGLESDAGSPAKLRIGAAAAGDGLQGGGGSALAVKVADLVGDGIESDGASPANFRVKASDIAGAGLEADASSPPNLRIAAAAAGDGLQGGAGSALAVKVADLVGDGIESDGASPANFRVKATDIAGIGLTTSGSPANLDVKAELLVSQAGVQVTDAAASTATAEKPIHINQSGVTETVASVDIVNDVTRAGDNTNNFTINIFRRNSAGTQATIVTYTNNVAGGGVTAWLKKNLGSLANTAIADGESISFSVTKAGSGQALNCRIEIKLTTPG